MKTSTLTLAELKAFEPREIKDLAGPPILVSRLCEIGFLRGESVEVQGRALFGEPILVELRGAVVALRKEEAACVKL